MGLAVEILGLVIFLGAHVFVTMRDERAALIARLGEWPYRGLFALVSTVGIVVVAYGFAEYRAAGPIMLWYPPAWTRHIVVILMWPASIMVAAAYIRGNIQRRLKHPLLVSVKTWAFAHLCANGDLGGIILFGSVLAWAVFDRITLKRRADPGAPPIPVGWNQKRHHRHHRRHHHISGAGLSSSIRSSSACRRSARRRWGITDVGAKRNPAAVRARHSRPQGRRTDRVSDFLSCAHRAPRRRSLRRDPRRRLARHGDARARDHGAGHARHDDPAGPCRDARLEAGVWWSSTCRSAPTRLRRSRPSSRRRG